ITHNHTKLKQMKGILKIVAVIAIMIMAAAAIQRCQKGGSLETADPRGEVIEVDIAVDTIKDHTPQVVAALEIGSREMTLPVKSIKSRVPAVKIRGENVEAAVAEDYFGEGSKESEEDNSSAICENDSIVIELPVEQRIYEGKDYKAWVSGVDPRLDSISVTARREIVTVKKPPDKWHIGPTIGYGITPQGLQPYIGISITYSIISF
ncbi:MAG: hypothetical protein K2M80_05775, partial [Muribaculaceae bacterium]|nr:hypothetical protein [Muribaculaceae bacterium]